MAEDYTNVARLGVLLLDPGTGRPYKASFTSTTVEGNFDPAGLATEAKQDSQVAAVNGVAERLGETLNVHVVDAERPLAVGAATGAKQDAEITRLNDIYNLLGAGIEVTDTRETVPVSIQALPLPLGASTATKQDAVISRLNESFVAEVTNTVSVSLADNGVQVENPIQITNTEFAVTPKAGATFPVSGSVALTNPSLPVTGTLAISTINSPVPVTDNGQSLTVDGQVGVSGGTITIDNTALPLPTGASTAALQATLNGSLASIDGKTPALGQKTAAASSPVVLASDQGILPVSVGNFPASQSVAVSNFPASQNVAVSNFPATQAVTGTVTANPSAPSATAGGLSAYRNAAAGSAPATVKTAQGRVYGYHFANPNTSWVYVHFYNALIANVTVGTTTPIATFGVPANAVLDGYWSLSDVFGTAISIAVTTLPGNNVAPSTAILVQLAYI